MGVKRPRLCRDQSRRSLGFDGHGLESAQIDVAAAEAAVERAKAAMKEDHGAEEVVAIQASLQKALAQLHVKRPRHS